MSNSSWFSSETNENVAFVHTIIDLAFKAAGIATFAVGAYNYAAIIHAITCVTRGHPHQGDQRLAEEGIRLGGVVAEHAVEAAADGLARLNHAGDASRLREVLARGHQVTAVINP